MAHRKTLGVYDRRYSTVLRGSTIGGREALVPWPKRIKEEARASTPSTTANSNKNKKNSNDKQSSKKNVKSTAVPYGRGIVKAVSRVSLEDRFGPNKDDVTEIIKSINGIDTSTANSSYLTTANYDDSYNAMDGSNEFDESHTATARKSSDEEVIHRTISFSNMIETNRPTSPKAPLKFTPKAIGSKVEMVRQMSSTDYNLNNTPKAVRPHTADGMRAKSNFSDLMEDVSRQRPSSSQPTPLLPIPRPDGKKSTRQEPQHVKTTASKAAFESLGGIGYVSPSEKMIEHMMDLFSDLKFKSTGPKCYKTSALSTINEWKAIYKDEHESFRSANNFAEHRYRELLEKEKEHGAAPTKVKATICADLLLNLTKKDLIWEILNCIFCNLSELFDRKEVSPTIAELFEVPTYFEHCEELIFTNESLLQEVSLNSQGVAMKDIVKKFQTIRMAFDTSLRFIRDACFQSVAASKDIYNDSLQIIPFTNKEWKRIHYRERILSQKAHRNKLRCRFIKWREFVKERREIDLQQYDHVLTKNLMKLSETHKIDKEDTESILSFTEKSLESLQLSALLSPDSVISRKHIIDHITNIVNGSIDIKSSLNVNSDIKDDDASSEVTSKQSLTKEKRDSLFKVMNLTQISVASDDSLVGVKLAEQEKRNESGINDNVISSERNENISSSVMRISGLTRHLSPIDTNSVHEVLSPIVDRHALSKTPNRKAFAEYIQKKIMSSIANSSFYKSAQAPANLSLGEGAMNSSEVSDSIVPSKDEVVRRVANIAGQLAFPQKDQMTQTPDNWMNGFECSEEFGTMVNTESLLSENSNNKNESGISFRGIAEQSKRNSVGFDLSWTNSNETDNVYSISGPDTHRYSSSNSNSNLDLIKTSMNQSSSSKNLETGNEANQSDHTVERKGKSKRRRSIIGLSKDRKVNSETASAIIAVVYDAKVQAMRAQENNNVNANTKWEFCGTFTLLDYTRDILTRRYGIKRLAVKNLEGLIGCCEKNQDKSNKRLKLFSELCGLIVEDEDHSYSGANSAIDIIVPTTPTSKNKHKFKNFNPSMCNFFFKMLNTIFDPIPKKVMSTFNTLNENIDRNYVLDAIRKIFPQIERHDVQLLRHIATEIYNLPAKRAASDVVARGIIQKINIDAALDIMLDYHEIELNFEAQNKVDLNNLKKPIRRVSLLSSDHNGLSLNIRNVAHNKNIADDDSVEHMENSDTHNDENLLVISDPLKDYSTIRRTNRQIPQRRRSSIVKEILHHHPFDAQDTNNEKELLKLEKVMKEQRDLDAGASLAMAMSGNIAVAKYNSFSLNIDATKKSDSIDLQEVENDDFVKKLSIEDYHK